MGGGVGFIDNLASILLAVCDQQGMTMFAIETLNFKDSSGRLKTTYIAKEVRLTNKTLMQLCPKSLKQFN